MHLLGQAGGAQARLTLGADGAPATPDTPAYRGPARPLALAAAHARRGARERELLRATLATELVEDLSNPSPDTPAHS